MAAHLDLEEQEQLDQLKAFWAKWGNLLTWVLIAVLAAYAAWNGWNYWQRRQALEASALFEELERASKAGDHARVERAFADMRAQQPKAALTAQGAFLFAKSQVDLGKPDAARAALEHVAASSGDEGHQALARLRLAALLIEAKNLDAALAQLNAKAPAPFMPLFDDRRGDVFCYDPCCTHPIIILKYKCKYWLEYIRYSTNCQLNDKIVTLCGGVRQRQRHEKKHPLRAEYGRIIDNYGFRRYT